MPLLEKLSIKQQLYFMFFIKMLFFSVFCVVAIVALSRIYKTTENIYSQPLVVTNTTLEIMAKTIKIHRDIKNVILLDDAVEQQTNIKEIDDLTKEVDNLFNILEMQNLGDEGKTLEKDTRKTFNEWKGLRNNIISKATSDNKQEAKKIANTEGNKFVDDLEFKTNQLYGYSKKSADTFMKDSSILQNNFFVLFIVMFVVLGLLSYIVFIVILKSLLHSLNALKNVMAESVTSNTLKRAVFVGNNEISEMAKDYNNLINKLETRIWLKDGINDLSAALYGKNTTLELAQSSINFLSRYLDAGHGVFFKYSIDDEKLQLIASFAFTEKDNFSNIFDMNYGVIGQVALERKPILLKNIKNSESLITTGTTNYAPLNTYTIPLIYEDVLHGVIELSSHETFTELKQNFLNEASDIVAINLSSVLQNDKVLLLLAEAETARKIAENNATQLSKQTETLYDVNAQLEEQQQTLEQKSELLQEFNIQLEDQQQFLGEQTISLKNKNVELEDRTKELQLSNKYKSEFVATISHELRTPLNAIILLSKSISEGKNSSLSDVDKEMALVINNSGNILLSLVNNILDLSKIEASKSVLNLSSFNSKDFLHQFDEMFQSFAVDKKLEFFIEDNINQILFSDKEKLTQIITNFVSNAFKFTEKGTIRLRIYTSGDNVYPVAITVLDTGIGMSTENIDKIFDAFYQVDSSIQRKFGGTGLGLHICSQISDLLGTTIKIHSVLGSGTEFTLLLPASCLNSSSTIANFPEDDRKSIITGEPTLLIIEDDINLSVRIINECKNLGIKILCTPSCHEGIMLAKKHIPTGIILDLDINNTEGLDTLKLFNTDIQLTSIPVALISDNQTDMLIGTTDCITLNSQNDNPHSLK